MDNEQFQEFVVQHLMKLDTKVSALTTDVSSLKTKMSFLENTVTRIETRMEHEIINKIKVLFDGHQLHEDRFDRIEKKTWHKVNLNYFNRHTFVGFFISGIRSQRKNRSKGTGSICYKKY